MIVQAQDRTTEVARALRARRVYLVSDWGTVWVGLAVWDWRARYVVCHGSRPVGTYRDGVRARIIAMRDARSLCE